MPDTNDRIRSLEEWRHGQEVLSSSNSIIATHINDRLKKIEAHLVKFVWLFVSSNVAIALGLMYSGAFGK